MAHETEIFIRNEAFSQERYNELLNEFFNCKAYVEKGENVRWYGDFYGEHIVCCFVEKDEPPDNYRKSKLLNADFYYSQSICFRRRYCEGDDTDSDADDRIIWEFLLFLEKKCPFEALVFEMWDIEVCHMDKNLSFTWLHGDWYKKIVDEILSEQDK